MVKKIAKQKKAARPRSAEVKTAFPPESIASFRVEIKQGDA